MTGSFCLGPFGKRRGSIRTTCIWLQLRRYVIPHAQHPSEPPLIIAMMHWGSLGGGSSSSRTRERWPLFMITPIHPGQDNPNQPIPTYARSFLQSSCQLLTLSRSMPYLISSPALNLPLHLFLPRCLCFQSSFFFVVIWIISHLSLIVYTVNFNGQRWNKILVINTVKLECGQ